MNCEVLEVGVRWVDLALGELPPDMLAEANQHLSTCAMCRAGLLEIQSDLRLLKELPRGPDVPESAFLLNAPAEGWPRLPAQLEARLLSIPDGDGAVSHSQPTRSAVLERTDALLRRLRTLVDRPMLRPVAAGVAFAMALMVLLPLEEPDIWKGGGDEAAQQLADRALRLELMVREPDGQLRRAEPEPLSRGLMGATVTGDPWLMPVLMSPSVDLTLHPWFVTIVVLEAERSPRILERTPQAISMQRVMGTASSFTVPVPFHLGGQRGQVGRLYILVTSSAIEPARLLEAASRLQVLSPRPVSLLAQEPLSGLEGFEGSMWMEVR